MLNHGFVQQDIFLSDSQKSTPNESSRKSNIKTSKAEQTYSFRKRLKVCVDVKTQYYANSPRRDKIVNWMFRFNSTTVLFFTVYSLFQRVDVNVAKYFWQWDARADQATISYELLSVDNFASFYPILSNICSKSSMYISLSHKTWLDEFWCNTKARTARNPIFVIQSIIFCPLDPPSWILHTGPTCDRYTAAIYVYYIHACTSGVITTKVNFDNN